MSAISALRPLHVQAALVLPERDVHPILGSESAPLIRPVLTLPRVSRGSESALTPALCCRRVDQPGAVEVPGGTQAEAGESRGGAEVQTRLEKLGCLLQRSKSQLY
jgi:hypothetical protein